MGWVMMSERELNRIEVLAQIDDGRLSVENGANMLGLTRCQVFRLLKRYRSDGAAAIRQDADDRYKEGLDGFNGRHSSRRTLFRKGCYFSAQGSRIWREEWVRQLFCMGFAA